MTKNEAIEKINQIIVSNGCCCDSGCPFNNMNDFCLLANDDFVKQSNGDCLRTETCKALFKDEN